VQQIRVVLVDDHGVVRRGLQSFLESFDDIVVVGSAESGEALLVQLDTWLPDVVVLDMIMPGGIDGVATVQQIRTKSPHTNVVMLTAITDDNRVIAALRAGAIGYVPKDADPELLLKAVRGAAQGRTVLDPTIAAAVMQDMLRGAVPGTELTEREMVVLRQLAHGRTNKEIAGELTVSTETVKTHVGNILAKLQMAHRTQAVIHALKQGLISLDEIEM
jgi:NarL family two-component system response regulator LiaR